MSDPVIRLNAALEGCHRVAPELGVRGRSTACGERHPIQ